MQNRDDGATCKKYLQTKGFHVQLMFARATRAHVVQRKCLTASDGSCLIVRYFFITWESAALLNTSKVARQQVLSGFVMRRIPEQERRDCNSAAPARKTSSKVTSSS